MIATRTENTTFHWPQSSTWSPPIDIYQTKKGWLVKCELAGVSRSDIEVKVTAPKLVIRGKRRDPMANRNLHQFSMEIAYSDFERMVQLPERREPTSITWELEDGMCLIDLVFN